MRTIGIDSNEMNDVRALIKKEAITADNFHDKYDEAVTRVHLLRHAPSQIVVTNEWGKERSLPFYREEWEELKSRKANVKRDLEEEAKRLKAQRIKETSESI